MRAAAYGIIIVAMIFISFGIILPRIGLFIGNFCPHVLPDTNVFKLLSDLIASSYIFQTSEPLTYKPSLDMASISIISIVFTWLFKGLLSIASTTDNTFLKIILFANTLKETKDKSIEELFKTKSPVEYQLLTIAKKAKEDITYNMLIKIERDEIYSAVKQGIINRKSRSRDMSEIFKALEYRAINYALISLDNDKFYIGLPTIIPEPDEESIASNSIQIIPTMSGYRNKKRTLKITTIYDFDTNTDNTSDYERISISREKIVSVSGFLVERHNRISIASKKPPKKNKEIITAL